MLVKREGKKLNFLLISLNCCGITKRINTVTSEWNKTSSILEAQQYFFNEINHCNLAIRKLELQFN